MHGSSQTRHSLTWSKREPPPPVGRSSGFWQTRNKGWPKPIAIAVTSTPRPVTPSQPSQQRRPPAVASRFQFGSASRRRSAPHRGNVTTADHLYDQGTDIVEGIM